MKNKIQIIEKVEAKRRQEKFNILDTSNLNKDLSAKKLFNIILRRLDRSNRKFEIIN